MNTKIKLKTFNLISIYIVIGLIIIMFYPSKVDLILKQNYIMNTISYLFMGLIFITILINNKVDILDPIVFISLIYIPMLSIIPIIDIITGDILYFGVNVFDYGIKGSLIATMGYFIFSIGYLIPLKKNKINKKNIENNYNISKVIYLSLFSWIICLFISIVYLVFSGGYSLSYIFTLGLNGKINSQLVSQTSIGVLSMFSYSLIPTSLVYTNYGKSKLIKLIMLFCTLTIQLIQGFRFIVIILVLAHAYMYYLKNNKRPSLRIIIISLLIVVCFIGLMEFSRNSIRWGSDLDLSQFDINDIWEAVIGNFRIYKTYYAVIKAVPEMTPYMYGSQMIIYTLIMFIPRALWPNKPEPNGGEAIRLGLSQYALDAGQAYPCIGEYYYEFGTLGVIFLMWIAGCSIRLVKSKFLLNRNDDFDLIIYSIIIPTTFQLIIRGYTPSNFYLVLFLIIPIFIIKKLSIAKMK